MYRPQMDPGVPWQTSLRLAACLESAAVTVELIEGGDHRRALAQAGGDG